MVVHETIAVSKHQAKLLQKSAELHASNKRTKHNNPRKYFKDLHRMPEIAGSSKCSKHTVVKVHAPLRRSVFAAKYGHHHSSSSIVIDRGRKIRCYAYLHASGSFVRKRDIDHMQTLCKSHANRDQEYCGHAMPMDKHTYKDNTNQGGHVAGDVVIWFNGRPSASSHGRHACVVNNQSSHASRTIIWHTHPSSAMAYPSFEDLKNVYSGQMVLSIIFTYGGVWEMAVTPFTSSWVSSAASDRFRLNADEVYVLQSFVSKCRTVYENATNKSIDFSSASIRFNHAARTMMDQQKSMEFRNVLNLKFTSYAEISQNERGLRLETVSPSSSSRGHLALKNINNRYKSSWSDLSEVPMHQHQSA